MTISEAKTDNTIPMGQYKFIGIDIDTTGRRILDEIVHLAAYDVDEQFDQYVIPVMNLNPAARQRHQLRIISVGFFRMLKCTLTNKVIKCKTEIVALKTFLDWLEQRKADTDGVVLVYNESIKFIPYMLLEALKKYDLVERFSRNVVGFVDVHALGEAKYDAKKIQTFNDLAKEQPKDDDDEKNFEGNAMVRARTAYQIIKQMAKELNEDGSITADMVQGFVHSVNVDINELTNQNKCIDLQHTFRPIFVQFFKTNLYHRYKAVTFRRVLAEKGFDLKSLEDVWNEKKKDGLTEIISNLHDIKEENRGELVDILDSYFDPEKEAIVPPTKPNPRRRSYKKGSTRENRPTRENRSSHNADKMDKKPRETNNNEILATPDSITRSPRRHRRSRRRFSPKQLNKSAGEASTDTGTTNSALVINIPSFTIEANN